mmetsp:Transcript_22050/g.61350  ORF Transcript_22050/g.61350 Transcript_22050/m.61350 type:complete len:293 (+) Transcript_22050:764-1642(+)
MMGIEHVHVGMESDQTRVAVTAMVVSAVADAAAVAVAAIVNFALCLHVCFPCIANGIIVATTNNKQITFADGSEPLDLKTPCLFHNTDRTPKELKLATNDLYPLRIPIHLKGSIGMNFFVKRRVPSELRAGTASGSLSQQLSSSPSSLPFFSFDDDRLMKTFTEFFGAPTQNQGARNGGNGHLSSTVARPGMGGPKRVDQTQDQLEMIQSCWDLSIMSTIDATDTSRLSKTWDFRLLASYYRHWLAKQSHAMDTEAGGDDAIARHPPLNRELVAYLYAMMQDIQSKQKHFDG